MRKHKISVMYALPCLASAAVLYAANRLRKENKALRRAAAIHQSQMEAFSRCLQGVDKRNSELRARLDACRIARERAEKESNEARSEVLTYRLAEGRKLCKLEDELKECQEQIAELATDCDGATIALDTVKKELEESRKQKAEEASAAGVRTRQLERDKVVLIEELEKMKLELAQVRSASADILAETMAEVKWLYEYLDAEGYPEEQTRDFARQEFHGQVPSEVYRRQQNEQKMQAALTSGE